MVLNLEDLLATRLEEPESVVAAAARPAKQTGRRC